MYIAHIFPLSYLSYRGCVTPLSTSCLNAHKIKKCTKFSILKIIIGVSFLYANLQGFANLYILHLTVKLWLQCTDIWSFHTNIKFPKRNISKVLSFFSANSLVVAAANSILLCLSNTCDRMPCVFMLATSSRWQSCSVVSCCLHRNGGSRKCYCNCLNMPTLQSRLHRQIQA